VTATAGFNRRRRRAMLWSLIVVLVISFGSLAATLAAGWSPKLGLDLAGGTELVITPVKGNISPSQQAVAVQIIQNRVTGFGVSGATVQTQGSQIIVQIPGINNGRRIQNELLTLAQLYFRPVECYVPAYAKPAPHVKPNNPLKVPNCSSQYLLTQANITIQGGNETGNPGPDPSLGAWPSIEPTQDDPDLPLIEPGAKGTAPTYEDTNDVQQTARYLVLPAVLKGTAVASATADQNQLGQWVVDCTLTASGSASWDQVTKEYFHQFIAVDLDGTVESAPLILPGQSTWSSFMGQVEISGNFTQASASSLATDLNYGSLPVALKVLNSDTVSPTLGHSALVAGLGAGLAGLILVLLYVLLYYRMLGFVVITGLGVTAALLWAIISSLGRTSVAPSFDLAGVTGIIVSIGITVDSYIVYFERLKDETRAGRSVRTSLDRGFASAWRTVLAADTVSFLAAVLLFFLAAGSVQGFAFFLGLSTLLDVFVTWFFTRPAVSLLGRSEVLTSMRRLGIARGLAVGSGAPVPA
jgi:preprotein translocase subunit SecD